MQTFDEKEDLPKTKEGASFDEREYIANNFPALRQNYQKYAAINLVIKSKIGRLIRFLFNRMQKHLWLLYLEDLASGKPIRWFVIKSRQQGSTSWFIGLVYWLTSLFANKNALLISQDEPSSIALGSKLQYLYARSKDELRPKCRVMNRKQIHFATSLEEMEKTGDTGLDSVIDITSGDSEGIGRSRTYQYVLITEFSKMEDMGIDIPKMMDALAQCVERSAETAIFIENTIVDNQLIGSESYAKEFWENQLNGYRKIFISWVAADEYTVDLSLGNYPELSSDPNSQYGDEVDEFEAIKEALVEWYPEFKLFETDEFIRFNLHHQAYCRIIWRRNTLDTQFFDPDYVERRIKFKQEYPTRISDVWSVGSKTIFSVKRILEREEELKDDDIIPVHYEFNTSVTNKLNAFCTSRYGSLRIFEQPDAQVRYVIGADCAQGLEGGDDLALVVLKHPSLTEVASFNEIIPPSKFSSILNWLGRIYNNALLAVELNDFGGHIVLEFLIDKHHYPNLYFMDNQNIQNIRYGWVTNKITKEIMVGEARDLFRDKFVTANSKELLKQLKTFIDLGNGKCGAMPGKHDDLAMAWMIALQASKSIHIPREAPKPKVAPKGSPDYLIAQMNAKDRVRDRFNRKYAR